MDLAEAGADDRLDRGVGRIRGRQLLPGECQHPRDVERDIPVADDDRVLSREIERELLEVRVAVVPGDELGRSPRPREILARNPEPAVGLGPHRVNDRVVERGELILRHVPPDLDIAEEAEAGSLRDPLESARDRLQVRMIRGNPEPDEAPRRG